MSSSIIFSLFQLSFVLSTAIQLIASVFLAKEKAGGTAVMIGGGVVSMLGQVGYWVVPLYLRYVGVGSQLRFFYLASAVIALGSLIFAIGLLLYGLHRRGQASRVEELEAILESIHKS
ncbi:hypothetical protein JIN84_22210 [Luteolibacter yonseiensis]|uniref:Uncharacterized protein n=1 Tax=Luteolibacter yonseiensis TaxID=1144680 RepID=A0A934RAV6_9BACT|nr:hypothetical protein [Luteolibacter yonseiensis]MBK1818350.1 hypothetical protein [Luteolibacter yonseiensis]